MNFSRIKETCLYVRDVEQAKCFYHEILGLPLISHVPGKHTFFRAGTSVLLCFNPEDSKTKKSPPAHYGGGQQHFAFEVKKSDYRRTKEEIISKGVTIIDEVVWESGAESFYFRDPEGNVLEVIPNAGIWD
jgi:catechol 2,3-dioxygenase-like lactoylglutathione lyase family enzyme